MHRANWCFCPSVERKWGPVTAVTALLVTFEITEIIEVLGVCSTNFVSNMESAVTVCYSVLLYLTIRLCHHDWSATPVDKPVTCAVTYSQLTLRNQQVYKTRWSLPMTLDHLHRCHVLDGSLQLNRQLL
jgi:hypothetical protein